MKGILFIIGVILILSHPSIMAVIGVCFIIASSELPVMLWAWMSKKRAGRLLWR
jgi:multisubunit Na+/H+ antiporter MnhC subunit